VSPRAIRGCCWRSVTARIVDTWNWSGKHHNVFVAERLILQEDAEDLVSGADVVEALKLRSPNLHVITCSLIDICGLRMSHRSQRQRLRRVLERLSDELNAAL
jgi:hypothetical protein